METEKKTRHAPRRNISSVLSVARRYRNNTDFLGHMTDTAERLHEIAWELDEYGEDFGAAADYLKQVLQDGQ